MENAKNRLINGTVVYMIGNATSRLLQLLLLPIITGLLLTTEYGYYDLVISTISLVLPLFTLQLVEALFKYLFKINESEKGIIVSTAVVFLFLGTALFAAFIFIVNKFTGVIQYPTLIFFHYSTFTAMAFYQKITRSLQKNTSFAISGVMHTFVLICTQLLFLLVLNMRVEGLLAANVIANLSCVVYLENVTHASKVVSLRNVRINTLKELLRFSAPLVPNSIVWWFVSSVNRYFITYFLGIGYNGIFSIANKFPSLLSFITSVFQMAWQESAIMESDSESRINFYSDVFNTYIKLLITGMIAILPLIKIVMPYLVDISYMSGMVCVPPLLAGVVFASFSQFYGVGYLAFNKTKDAFSTTIIAAIINSIFCISLIPVIGLLAPAIGTMLAFAVQWCYRIFQMKSYFRLQIQWWKFTLYSLIAVGYTLMFYIITSQYVQGIIFILAALIFILANKVLLKGLVNKLIINVRKG
jgi:O-antigen/teichoic acid export membrane protein